MAEFFSDSPCNMINIYTRIQFLKKFHIFIYILLQPCNNAAVISTLTDKNTGSEQLSDLPEVTQM